jgi:uncharacterized protein
VAVSPTVVAVSGHMVDAPDRTVQRFPPGQLDRVTREIEHAFDAWAVGPGTTVLCGGARGADILAAEAGLRRDAQVQLCLALPPDEFEKRSVELPDTDWLSRFREVRKHSTEEVVSTPDKDGADGDPFVRANIRIIGLAQSKDPRPHALLVWNGAGGDGPGGTADFVHRLGYSKPDARVCVIDPTPRPYQDRQSAPGPKRLLALDGGGLRGVISLEILSTIEQQLRRRYQKPGLVLSDYFDYIGGTSTGAIIAAALAMGKPVDEIRHRYFELAQKVFQKRFLPLRLRSMYRDGPLTTELEDFFGTGTTLGDPKFQSLLLVVLHNTVTDSAWPLSNCTNAKYNLAERYLNPDPDRNLDVPLSALIRGSTAAPVYFPPQQLQVGSHEFVFQDGGMTPFNNPSLLMFLMSTLPEYALCWPTGEENLMVVSVGTGSAAAVHPGLNPRRVDLLFNASNFPGVFMRGASIGQDLVCRALARTRAGAPIDREFGSRLDAVNPSGSNLFTYLRYDADLSDESLASLGISEQRARKQLRKLDAVGSMPQLQVIGRSAAHQVEVDLHFAGFD